MFNFLFKKKDEANGFEQYINDNYNEKNDSDASLVQDTTNSDLQEPDYKDEGFKSIVIKTTKSKWFVPVIILLIILIIGILCFRAWFISVGTLKDINISAPDIIYLGDDEEVIVKAIGKGNLRKTNFSFNTSNSTIADVALKDEVKGKKVSNMLIPISTGRFALYVDAKLGDNKVNTKEKEIVVCKKLKEASIQSSVLNIENGKKQQINLDLGLEEECYKDINYDISNNDILDIDDDGNIIGKKVGTSKINISNNDSMINITVNVIESNALIPVKSLKLNKTSLSIEIGSTEKLIPTIEPQNASNQAIIWSSSNESVVTVNNNGLLKAMGKGNAVILAKTVDGGYQAKIDVKVIDKQDTKDNVAPKIKSIVMYSNNNDKTLAKVNDIITVVVEFNETITTKPQIEIAGKVAEVNNGTTKFIASIEVKPGMSNGKVSLKISNYKDKAGNTGNIETNVTSGKKVTIYTLSNWSNPTTGSCNDKELCKSVTLYRTSEEDVIYGKWNDFTTNKCEISDTCRKIIVYKKREGISNIYMGSSCGADKQIGVVCNRDGQFLHEGVCTVSDCSVPYNLWCTNTLRCEGTIYSNWSDWTTTKCTGENDVCQSTDGYQTRTKTVIYSNWSNWSTNKCDTSNKKTCETTQGFLTRTRITK